MILDATTDSLDIVLASAITTNQLSFTVYFDDFTSIGVTPTKNVSVTNSTTPVNLISAPAASHQRKLKYCSIFNGDTALSSVTIRFNNNSTLRNILIVTLYVNESIQYTPEAGWQVYDANGSLKVSGLYQAPGGLRPTEYFGAANTTTTLTLTNTNAFCFYLGKAERNFSSISIAHRVTTAITATVSWAEIAIYKGTPAIGANATLGTRLGFTSTAGVWTATGIYVTAVSLSGCSAGDDLWVVFSNSTSGTVAQIRAGLVDDVQGGFVQTVNNARPSTNSSLSGTVQNATAHAWVSWQGT